MGDTGEFGAGGGKRGVVAKAGNAVPVVRVTTGDEYVAFARNPKFGVIRKMKTGRQDTDDRGRLIADFQVNGGKVASAAESLLPVGITDEGGRRSVEALLFWKEGATKNGLHAHHRKEIARDESVLHARRFATPGDGSGIEIKFGEAGEGVILRAKVYEIGIGEVHAAAEGVLFPEPDNLLRIMVRERAEQDAVDDGKDGGGGADAEGESENRDDGKRGRFFEKAKSEASVVESGFEEWKRASFAVSLFGLLGAAELDQGLAAGLLRGEAVAKIFLDGEIEVDGHFVGEIVVEAIATEEGGDAMEEAEVHGSGASMKGG